MEVFYFRHKLTPGMAELARHLHIPEGRPFILDDGGATLGEVCTEFGIDYKRLTDDSSGAAVNAATALSRVSGINEYLLYRTSTSNSANTWKSDAEQLGIFLRWVKEQGKKWEDVTLEDLRSFYRSRRLQPSPHTKRPISSKTWNAAVGAISRLYLWAAEKGLIQALPFTFRQIRHSSIGLVEKNILTESVGDDPVRYLTLEEYKLFREALMRSRNGGRDRTFADVLVTTGLRLSEANKLTAVGLPDPEAPRYAGIKAIPFLITGKGRKTRKIRFPKSTLREIEIYKGEDRSNAVARLTGRAANRNGSRFSEPQDLWLTERGTLMTAARWEEIFAETSTFCGIHCTPHMLRHTYAIYTLSAIIEETICAISELRLRGSERFGKLLHNPLQKLADLLGHRHISTTFIYLDLIERCEAMVDDAIAEWTKGIA